MMAYPILAEFKEHQKLKKIFYKYSKKVFKDSYPVCCYRVNTNIYVKGGDFLKTEVVLILPRKECVIWDKKYELKYLRSMSQEDRDSEIAKILGNIHNIHLRNAERNLYKRLSCKFGANRYIKGDTE